MKNIFLAIKRFFLPADNSTILVRVLPLAAIAFVMILLFVFGNTAWEYTNEIKFCGLTCHTMPPEYITHQNSAHANVACEDCHMGRDKLAVMIPRKISYSWQTGSAMVTGRYTYPIVAKNMRPARDACENCHKPETFNSDALIEIKHFASDQKNTATSTFLSLNIGGGTTRQGLGLGIHWHIENPVYFYATDPERQVIPYVVVSNPDGTSTAYIDSESGLDPTTIKPDQLQLMDCITCHNRTAHGVQNPGNEVDKLMARDLISPSIPNIKAKGEEVISASYPNVIAASDAIAALDKYYQDNFADFYAANKDLITKAIQNLQDLYQNTNFPDQKFDWKTHPDNIGHINSPGCFRCHDGKHLNNTGQSVRLECNICHTIPVVAGPNQTNAAIQLNRGFEPESHKNTNWINFHRTLLDNSCKGCHTTDDAGGTSNKSFCSNSACHGAKYTFAGFDAPRLRQVLADQAAKMVTPTPTPSPTPEPTATPLITSTPMEITPAAGTPDVTAVPSTGKVTFVQIAPIFNDRCSSCHSSDGLKGGLDLSSYATVMKGGQDGPVILPNDPANSLMVKLQSADQPHFGQLSADELALVKQWIQSGALEK